MLVALQEKTNSAKSATARTAKALNSVLTAKNFHAKPPNKALSVLVIASISQANPNRYF
jgi:hypothetical protein